MEKWRISFLPKNPSACTPHRASPRHFLRNIKSTAHSLFNIKHGTLLFVQFVEEWVTVAMVSMESLLTQLQHRGGDVVAPHPTPYEFSFSSGESRFCAYQAVQGADVDFEFMALPYIFDFSRSADVCANSGDSHESSSYEYAFTARPDVMKNNAANCEVDLSCPNVHSPVVASMIYDFHLHCFRQANSPEVSSRTSPTTQRRARSYSHDFGMPFSAIPTDHVRRTRCQSALQPSSCQALSSKPFSFDFQQVIREPQRGTFINGSFSFDFAQHSQTSDAQIVSIDCPSFEQESPVVPFVFDFTQPKKQEEQSVSCSSFMFHF